MSDRFSRKIVVPPSFLLLPLLPPFLAINIWVLHDSLSRTTSGLPLSVPRNHYKPPPSKELRTLTNHYAPCMIDHYHYVRLSSILHNWLWVKTLTGLLLVSISPILVGYYCIPYPFYTIQDYCKHKFISGHCHCKLPRPPREE